MMRAPCSTRLTVTGLAFCLLSACSEEPRTQVVVTVRRDAEMANVLRAVRLRTYEADQTDPALFTDEQRIDLSTHVFERASDVTLPFSFGIDKGRAARFRIVVEGFESDDPLAPAMVEQKRMVDFREGQAVNVELTLARVCYDKPEPCAALNVSCHGEVRACVPVGDATVSNIRPGEELEHDAGSTQAAACPADNLCRSLDYPCVPLSPHGYLCEGQFADWPIAEHGPDSKLQPLYDFDSDPTVVRDQITGLLWQRMLPPVYEGCTGTDRAANDSCSWDEAAAYCASLVLGDHKWRLPSKAELISLVEFGTIPAFDTAAFPNTPFGFFWTSTLYPFSRTPQSNFPVWMWNVATLQAGVLASETSRKSFVRCVSDRPHAGTTPADRYVSNAKNKTFTDTRTQLEWAIDVSEPLATWDEAKSVCRAGSRLPSIKELSSLVDDSRYGPAVDARVPMPKKSYVYWSGTGHTTASDGAWRIDLETGYISTEGDLRRFDPTTPPEAARVRCVR